MLMLLKIVKRLCGESRFDVKEVGYCLCGCLCAGAVAIVYRLFGHSRVGAETIV